MKILNYLKNKTQNGGSNVLDSVTGAITDNIVTQKIRNVNSDNLKYISIVSVIIIILLCILLILLGYGLYKQRVKKDSEYHDLGV